ncbi:flippase [Aquimarina gracilis]
MGINIFVVFFVAKKVSISDFGSFSLAFIFSSLGILLLDYGFNLKSLILSGKKEQEINRNLSLMVSGKIIVSLASLIFFIPFLLFNTYDDITNKIIAILVFSAIPASFGNFYLNSFKIVNRFDKEAIGYIIQGGLLFVLLFINEFFGKNDIIYFAYILALIRVVYFLYSVLVFNKSFSTTLKLEISKVFTILKNATPYAIHLILGASIIYIDTFILSLLSSIEDVGLYQAGMRIIMASMLIAVIISDAFIPEISGLLQKREEVKLKLAKLFEFVMFFSFLAIATVFFYDRTIIQLLFSEEYLVLENFTIYILSIMFLRYIGIVPGIILTCYGRQDLRAKAVIVSVIFSIMFNLILIPVMGIKGAFLSSLAAHIVLNIIYVFGSLRIQGFIKLEKNHFFLLLLFVLNVLLQKLLFRDILFDLILTAIINLILLGIYYKGRMLIGLLPFYNKL